MKSDSHPIIALLLVVIVFGGSLTVCFWPQDGKQQEEFSITGTVTGISSYNQPKLDIKAQQLFDNGMELGDTFTITTSDAVYEDAILIERYQGMFMFDYFVNVETDGYISVGFFGKLITADKGSEITLTHSGSSDRYNITPLYNAGYTNSRADYDSDEQFANFYEVTGGNLKDGILYRSFSPLYEPDKQTRSPYVSELAEKAGIQYEIALSYSESSIKTQLDKESVTGYCPDLCRADKYVAPGMGYLYFQQKEKTVQVLDAILDNDGAYLIHCNVGRDRTGFVVLLLQALCGCTAEEMSANEAQAFCNLCHIKEGTQEYDVVVDCTYDRNMYLIANPDKIDDMFTIDWNNIDVSSVDTAKAAYSYCTTYLGMSSVDVDALIAKLCV